MARRLLVRFSECASWGELQQSTLSSFALLPFPVVGTSRPSMMCSSMDCQLEFRMRLPLNSPLPPEMNWWIWWHKLTRGRSYGQPDMHGACTGDSTFEAPPLRRTTPQRPELHTGRSHMPAARGKATKERLQRIPVLRETQALNCTISRKKTKLANRRGVTDKCDSPSSSSSNLDPFSRHS